METCITTRCSQSREKALRSSCYSGWKASGVGMAEAIPMSWFALIVNVTQPEAFVKRNISDELPRSDWPQSMSVEGCLDC